MSTTKSGGVLGLIPARGGSKGVPRKNVRAFGGKPLIAWTLDTAQACALLDRVVVSTDDQEIADTARSFGADVPFMRPAELAGDDVTDLPVCKHALNWLAENEQYQPDLVVWLRPTAPLRAVIDIATAVSMLRDSNADSLRSVCAVEHHPYWMYSMSDGMLKPLLQGIETPMQRQALPTVFRLNGVVDAVRASRIPDRGHLFQGRMLGYVMPHERSVDIDHEIDFSIAELYLK